MGTYIAKRLINTAVVLLGVVVLTFFLMRITDGDPATIIALDRYGSQLISPEVIAELSAREGLDRPVHEQFYTWLAHLARGDLGHSLNSGVPVIEEIRLRFPRTLQLALASIGVTALIAVPLGIFAAFRQGGGLDRATRMLAAVKVSVPNFYMALILILIFSVKLRWLPSFGSGGLRHMVLPVTVLVFSQAGFTMRIVRSTVRDILRSEYVAYAVARGLSRTRILFVHVLKNAWVPIITYLSLQFLMALEGAVIVETIFAWPGMGMLFKDAVLGRDFTMIQALVLFSGVMITLVNFGVDMLYFFVDRRMKIGGR